MCSTSAHVGDRAGGCRQHILILQQAFLRLSIFIAFLFVCLTTLLCESVQIILCLCTIGPGSQLKFVCL